jgi:hypothetical protein
MVALFLFLKGMTGALAPLSYLVNERVYKCSLHHCHDNSETVPTTQHKSYGFMSGDIVDRVAKKRVDKNVFR